MLSQPLSEEAGRLEALVHTAVRSRILALVDARRLLIMLEGCIPVPQLPASAPYLHPSAVARDTGYDSGTLSGSDSDSDSDLEEFAVTGGGRSQASVPEGDDLDLVNAFSDIALGGNDISPPVVHAPVMLRFDPPTPVRPCTFDRQ